MPGLAGADVFIAGVLGRTAGVAHGSRHHARDLAEALFDAPEAALGERRHLVISRGSQRSSMTRVTRILAAIRIANHSVLLRSCTSNESDQQTNRKACHGSFEHHGGGYVNAPRKVTLGR